jgi:succinylarginine dihydrolase
VEVPAAEVSLEDAIRSYLFNAQLVTPPDGRTTLIVPEEARETPSVWSWLQRHLAGNGAIRDVRVVDVRQSMANGGGPACLRLRVVCDPRPWTRASLPTR